MFPRARLTVLLGGVLLAASLPSEAQTVTERGFIELKAVVFPLKAPNDPTRALVDLLGREELFVKPAPWIQMAAGVDFRADSHDQVEHAWALDYADRGVRRPRLSVRRLSVTITRGPLTVDVGKQFIRWGKTDILNPTDRFAPRDFLGVVNSEFLAVTAVRGVVSVRTETLEVVWVPRFTPSRVPLLDQRWTAVPPAAAGIPLVDRGTAFPGGAQAGVRWGHVGSGYELSASFFDGFNHLPDITSVVNPLPLAIEIVHTYPEIRTFGADAAVPTPWFTIKGEAAYFTSPDSATDEYALYVVQLERQTGEWTLVGGYAGEAVTRRRTALTFAPDRGLTRAFVARAAYTIDPNRSVAFEGSVRQNARGAYGKVEFSQAHGQHWRTTVAGTLIAGDADDFFGQYRRNSHLALSLRYSF